MQSHSPYDRFFVQSIAGGSAPPAPDQINTNFGIYWGAVENGTGGFTNQSTFFSELETYNFRGLRRRYFWPHLETADGVYDFSTVVSELNSLQTSNTNSGKSMKMLILIGTGKSNTVLANAHVVPAFMRDDPVSGTYKGGEWQYQTGNSPGVFGYRLVLWSDNVQARLLAMLTALQAELTAQGVLGLVEGIGFSETAITNALTVTVDANGYFANLKELTASLRTLFPTKVVFNFPNFPLNQIEGMVANCKTTRSVLGGPDIFTEDPDLNKVDNTAPLTGRGLYEWMRAQDGLVAKMVEVQHQDYDHTVPPARFNAGYPTHVPTIQELYDYGTADLKVHYLTFVRSTETAPGDSVQKWQKVLTFMNTTASPQKTILTGGCNTVVPTGYQP